MTKDKHTPPLADAARIRELLEAYGADPKRWPAEERENARALSQASGALADDVQAASQLDAILAKAPVQPPSQSLRNRILAQTPPGPSPFQAVWGGLGGARAAVARPALVLAGALFLGLAAGYAGQGVALDSQLSSNFLASAFSSTETVFTNGDSGA